MLVSQSGSPKLVNPLEAIVRLPESPLLALCIGEVVLCIPRIRVVFAEGSPSSFEHVVVEGEWDNDLLEQIEASHTID